MGTCLGGWEGVGLFSLRAVHDGEEIFADGWFARKPVVVIKRVAHDLPPCSDSFKRGGVA